MQQVSIFTISSNPTPNKLVTSDDRDPPAPWMNDFLKTKIKWRNQQINSIRYTYQRTG